MKLSNDDLRSFDVIRALLDVVDSYLPSEEKTGTVSMREMKGVLHIRSATGGCYLTAALGSEPDGSLESPVTVGRSALRALSLHGKEARLVRKENEVLVTSARARYRLPLQEVGRQGKAPVFESSHLTVSAALVKSVVNSVYFGHDDTGTGDVRLALGRGRISADTSDAFRGAIYVRKMDEWLEVPTTSVVLQHKQLLSTLSAFEDLAVRIQTSDRSASFSDGHVTIYLPVLHSQLRDTAGDLKQARAQLPVTASACVLTDDLKTAVKDALALLERKSRAPVEYAFEADRLRMTTHGELGSHEVRLPATEVVGAPSSFLTSPSYVKVMAALASRCGAHCRVEVLGDRVVCFDVRGDDTHALYLFSQKQR